MYDFQYIDDIYPFRMLDYVKYRKYLNMRKERERILKETRYVCHSAWNIHRKLYDERFRKVYLYLGRGNGHWRMLDRYLDLLESGRNVEVMNFTETTLIS